MTPASLPPPSRPLLWRLSRYGLRTAGVILVVYLGLAYAVTPGLWSHHNHQPGLAHRAMVTETGQGIAGDPINIGLAGTQDEIVTAMMRAGWSPADAVTFSTSVAIGKSVLLNRAYPGAPISALFYEGKKQALAFEKADGKSAKRRHHVRFWPVLSEGREGRPVWLGAASYDRGVGLSHYTGQITHHIGPDLDAERTLIIDDLTKAHALTSVYQVSGIGPTVSGRNGGGDLYFTDGEVAIGVLTAPSDMHEAPPDTIADPPAVTAKNKVWAFLSALARRSHAVPGEDAIQD